jgi:hypothetical protein
MKIIPWPRSLAVAAQRILVTLLTIAGVVLAGAGTATWLAAWRLAALAPGGVESARLSYNPFTGALRLDDVRARDAAGRVVFASPRIVGRADVGAVLRGHLELRRLDVLSPRVMLHTSHRGVVDLAGGQGWSKLGVPLTVEGVMVTDGVLLVRDATHGEPGVMARGIDVRLDRLEAASPRGWTDAAFIVRMTAYGTTVSLAGRPGAANDYAVTVRARDADLATWLRDVPIAGVSAGPGARGDVDATITFVNGRALVSGTARGGPVTVVVGETGHMRARGVHLVVERLDLATREGGNSTVHLQSPRVTLLTPDPAAVLDQARDLIARLRDGRLRRVTVVDGEVTVVTAAGQRVARVADMTAGVDARRRRDVVVSAAARVGERGRVSLRGVLHPGEGSFEGDVHLADLALSTLGAPLVSSTRGSRGALSFSGHVNVADVGGAPSALVWGQASLAAARMTWRAAGRRDFSADALTVMVRRYEWPRGIAVIDSLTLTRPEWSAGATAADAVSVNDDGVVVTQSVAPPTPLDGLLAAVETASRHRIDAEPSDGAISPARIEAARSGGPAATADRDTDVPAALPLVP